MGAFLPPRLAIGPGAVGRDDDPAQASQVLALLPAGRIQSGRRRPVPL